MIVGCVIAIMIDNPFLVPVFAIAFAMIPFIYAKRTVAYYDNHVKEELETALSIITTSYVRTDDIVSAVKENIQYLKPPVKDIFPCGHDACRSDLTSGVGVQLPDELHDNL